ncbi:MAG: nicotinate-nucleotide adenylyltransferase [Agathobacter sp.]|nr:nicotinate-nucleotide adenylyltransferase [Agathobacter sp.]
MKIGILGGSFDPIHNGHLNMALKSYEQYNLDEVWLIPNGNAPHKDSDKMADAKHRLAMCQLVADEYPFLRTCDIEITSEEYSYTYITVTKLQEMYPEYEFYFIMGADSLDYFDKWRKPEVIASVCKILVINRDEFSEEDMAEKIKRINSIFPADISIVHCPKVDVSSTELRHKLVKEDVLSSVYDYICRHDLYGN